MDGPIPYASPDDDSWLDFEVLTKRHVQAELARDNSGRYTQEDVERMAAYEVEFSCRFSLALAKTLGARVDYKNKVPLGQRGVEVRIRMRAPLMEPVVLENTQLSRCVVACRQDLGVRDGQQKLRTDLMNVAQQRDFYKLRMMSPQDVKWLRLFPSLLDARLRARAHQYVQLFEMALYSCQLWWWKIFEARRSAACGSNQRNQFGNLCRHYRH